MQVMMRLAGGWMRTACRTVGGGGGEEEKSRGRGQVRARARGTCRRKKSRESVALAISGRVRHSSSAFTLSCLTQFTGLVTCLLLFLL